MSAITKHADSVFGRISAFLPGSRCAPSRLGSMHWKDVAGQEGHSRKPPKPRGSERRLPYQRTVRLHTIDGLQWVRGTGVDARRSVVGRLPAQDGPRGLEQRLVAACRRRRGVGHDRLGSFAISGSVRYAIESIVDLDWGRAAEHSATSNALSRKRHHDVVLLDGNLHHACVESGRVRLDVWVGPLRIDPLHSDV